jgi:hypothetical protein
MARTTAAAAEARRRRYTALNSANDLARGGKGLPELTRWIEAKGVP